MEALEIKQLFDLDQILCTLTCLGKDLHNQMVNSPNNLKKIAKKFSENAVVYSITRRGVLKGICAFYCNYKITKTAYLTMIVVEKKEQGKGYGSLLMHEMLRYCKENGMEKIQLEVACTNETAYRFYIKHGFHRGGLPGKTGSFLMEMDI